MTTRILQISDTHLSPVHTHFQSNYERLLEWMSESPPDLVIVTGDLSLDGADQEADLRFAAEQLARLPAPWLALPGNHDVGDYPVLGGHQPTDATRMARWRAVLGADHFVEDVPGWRLIGLNTQTMGSGLPEEAAQEAALHAAVAGAAGRATALFLHKPLCQHRLDDTVVDYWPVLQPARTALVAAFGATPPRFVASGHIHQWRDHAPDGLRQIWAPPLSFIVGEDRQPSIGSKLIGLVEHLLHEDGTHDSRLLLPERLALNDLSRLPHLYARPVAAA
ncbi:metallophosphoesterase family protein [Roseococcus microcysteis]|uniref:metallophosphoesterase family protein n=1 Tax=Roseococcus microcysteis TaxID=2771361 RepID=UPI00168BBAC3|nr:metallophosphoesterase [Roseococcus microcysteis]